MKKLFDEQLLTFVNKNSDYGNSFERSLETHGLLASIVRMEDKINRLSTLASSNKDAQIASERLSDTLMDLSNYATMTAAWFNNNPRFGFSEEFVHQDIASIYPELNKLNTATYIGDISLYKSLTQADTLCKKQCTVKGLEDAKFFWGVNDYDLNYSSLNYFVDVDNRYYAIVGLDVGFIKYIVMQMINNDIELFNKYGMCKDGAKYDTVREFLGILLTNIEPEKEISISELDPELILPIVNNLKYQVGEPKPDLGFEGHVTSSPNGEHESSLTFDELKQEDISFSGLENSYFLRHKYVGKKSDDESTSYTLAYIP